MQESILQRIIKFWFLPLVFWNKKHKKSYLDLLKCFISSSIWLFPMPLFLSDSSFDLLSWSFLTSILAPGLPIVDSTGSIFMCRAVFLCNRAKNNIAIFLMFVFIKLLINVRQENIPRVSLSPICFLHYFWPLQVRLHSSHLEENMFQYFSLTKQIKIKKTSTFSHRKGRATQPSITWGGGGQPARGGGPPHQW